MIRAGVIGATGVGHTHIVALRELGIEVAGIAGSSPGSAECAARRLDVARAFRSAEELIASPEVDVVHVCAPDDLHRRLAVQALESGKHLICEKPLASTIKDAEAIARAALTSSAVATVCYSYRFARLTVKLRGLVREELGRVHAVRATYLQNWRLNDVGDGWRARPAPPHGSSSLADIGTHIFDLLECVLDDEIADLDRELSRIPDLAPDVGAAAIGRMRSGALVSVNVSQATAAHTNHLCLEFDGGRAGARWTLSDVETLNLVEVQNATSVRSGVDVGSVASGSYWKGSARGDERIRGLLGAFYQSVDADIPPSPSPHLPMPSVADAARHVELVTGSAAMASDPWPGRST